MLVRIKKRKRRVVQYRSFWKRRVRSAPTLLAEGMALPERNARKKDTTSGRGRCSIVDNLEKEEIHDGVRVQGCSPVLKFA